jgi:hypothetical protein
MEAATTNGDDHLAVEWSRLRSDCQSYVDVHGLDTSISRLEELGPFKAEFVTHGDTQVIGADDLYRYDYTVTPLQIDAVPPLFRGAQADRANGMSWVEDHSDAAGYATDRNGDVYTCQFQPSDVLAVITWDLNGHQLAASPNDPQTWTEWVMRPNGKATLASNPTAPHATLNEGLPSMAATNSTASTPSIKDRAFGRIAGYDERVKILGALGIKRVYDGIPVVRYRPTRPAAAATVEAEIEDLLIAGKDVPMDVAAPIVAAEKYDAEQVARAAAIDAVARRFAGSDDIFTPRAIQPALEYLRGELSRVVESAKELSGLLGPVTTAAEVINADKAAVESWRALNTLADEYEQIRTAQRELHRTQHNASVIFTDAQFEAVALFADALELHPHWVQRRKASALISNANTPQIVDYRKWLDSARISPAFADDLEPAYRIALIAETTTPWIPSPDQYDEAFKLAMHATNRATPSDIDAMELARVQYFEVTGAPRANGNTASSRADRLTDDATSAHSN